MILLDTTLFLIIGIINLTGPGSRLWDIAYNLYTCVMKQVRKFIILSLLGEII